MRSFVSSPDARPARLTAPAGLRRRSGLRRLAGALGAVGASALVGACSWITGVPNVCRVAVTVQPNRIPARTSTNATGEAFSCGGARVTHPRRVVKLWSSNPSLATVNSNGSVFAIERGTVWIVGESDGKRDSAMVEIGPEVPTSIDVEPNPVNIGIGQTQQLTVIPRRSDLQPITGLPVTYTSTFPSVATVTPQGVVRGVALGRTDILVNVSGRERSIPVLVTPPLVASVVVRMPRNPIRRTERVPVLVQLRDSAGNELETLGRDIRYRSSDVTVATVDANGTVTAQGPGRARISVAVDGADRGAVDVDVTEIPVATVFLNPPLVFRLGAQNVLIPAALDSASQRLALTGRTQRFQVEDSTIVRISSQGVVTPLRIGTTAVRVSVDTASTVAAVEVTEMPIGRIRVDSAQVQRPEGGTFQFRAAVTDSLGRPITNRAVLWTSSNPALASVNPITGLATALSAGNAAIANVTITASLEQPNGSREQFARGNATLSVTQVPIARLEVSQLNVGVNRGAFVRVNVIAYDSNGTIRANRRVRVISENPQVATVQNANAANEILSLSEAEIRGNGSGTTRITFQALGAGDEPQGAPVTVTVNVGGGLAARRPAPVAAPAKRPTP